MISVVIPLYNKERFIEQSVQSVIDQTFPKWEIVIINDGSTDSSEALVRQFKDERIRLISIQNSGVSVARNRGIQESKYDYIAFLDADDWWAPSFLEDMLAAIRHFPKESIFASGRCRVFKKQTERYSHNYLPNEGEMEALNYFETISRHLPLINSSNVIIKKSLLQRKVVFREGQQRHEDHDLWLRLSVEKSVVFVNKALSYYRKTETNSTSNAKCRVSDLEQYFSTIRQVYLELSKEDQFFLRYYANRFMALSYLKNYGDFSVQEQKSLAPYLNFFCSGKFKCAYQISKIIPFSMYPFLKLLQR